MKHDRNEGSNSSFENIDDIPNPNKKFWNDNFDDSLEKIQKQKNV